MEEENIENSNSTNGNETANSENSEENVNSENDKQESETETLETETEDVEELKARVAKLEKEKQELYEMSKKAKGFVRDSDGKWVKKAHEVSKEAKKDDISMSELRSLISNNVPEEDTEKVLKYARMEGISISEALRTPELKAVLGVRAEMRKTAETSNAGKSRSGATKTSDETLLANARKGNLPQSDEDLSRLVRATSRFFKDKAN